MAPKSHSFLGKRYRIVETPSCLGGECDAPETKQREIAIPIHGEDIYDLEVCIHESLHACFWWMSESFVRRASHDIARLLWRLDWRKDA